MKEHPKPPVRRGAPTYGRLVAAGLCLVFVPRHLALAHEGHAPLPTTGATVQGDRLMLSAAAASAIGVVAEKVTLGDMERAIIANATVELPTHQQAFATTMAAGRVVEVLVQPGERVTAGQEMARVESASLATLQQEMLKASSELSLAERLLEQRTGLGDLVTGKLLLETRITRDSKAVERAIIRQKLRAIGLSDEQLDEAQASGRIARGLAIRSPIDGVVSEADVRLGQVVGPTEHLYHIVDNSRVWITANVLESDSAGVKMGGAVAMTFDALADETSQGRIAQVGVKMDAERHTEQIRVLLDNRGGRLQPGMFGQMRISVSRAAQAIVCPAEALIGHGARSAVIKEEGRGKLRRQAVNVGIRSGDAVEILDGLFPGDRVVTVGSQELAALFGVASAAPRAPAAPLVPASPSSAEPAPRTMPAVVELPTGRKSFASPSVEGKILRVLVERGQHVEAGEVLAEAESLELRNLCLEFLEMRLQLEFTKTSLDRLEQIAKESAVAQQDVWKMRSTHETYRHAVRSAKQRLELAGLSPIEVRRLERIELEDLEADKSIDVLLAIRAPADGWVADYQLAIGQVVKADEQLFEIQDFSRVWIKAFAFEQDMGRIKLGRKIEVRLMADPAFEASATISRVSPVLMSAGRVQFLWAELANPEHRLKEGMLATAMICVPPRPQSAVARGSESPPGRRGK